MWLGWRMNAHWCRRPRRLMPIVVALGLTVVASPAAAAIPFAPAAGSPVETAGSGASGLSLLQRADLDADGRPDLVGVAPSSGALIGRTAPLFAALAPVDAGNEVAGPITSGDVDGDGRWDVVAFAVGEKGADQTHTFRGTTGGLVRSVAAGADASRGTFVLKDIALADATSDGKADLFITGTSGTSLEPGIAGPGFTTSGAAGAATNALTGTIIAVGDVTGDGKADALVAGTDGTGPFARVLRSPGLTLGTLVRPGAAVLGAALADVTADGRADAIVVLAGSVLVYPAQPDGSLGTVKTTTLAGPTGTGLAAADLDGDGARDLALATGANDRVVVLRSKKDGTFDPAQEVTLDGGTQPRGSVGELVAADFDADGDQDLAVASRGAKRLDIVLNGTIRPPEPEVEPGPADHTATILEAPQRVVAGVPERLRAATDGSYGPYTYVWRVSGDGTANGADTTKAFAAVPLSGDQAAAVGQQGAGDGNTKRGSREVVLRVTDRYGRWSEATTQVTVLPNRAPITAFTPVGGLLEFAEPGRLRNESVDPDSGPQLEYDRIDRTEWTYGGSPKFSTSASSEGNDPSILPWRVGRAGVPLIADLTTPTLELPAGKTLPPQFDQQRVLAEALREYPYYACGADPAKAPPMYGCWPHSTSVTVTARSFDRAGASSEVTQQVPVRLRARPAADVTLRSAVETTKTGNTRVSNQELPQAINPGTELFFDPTGTTLDQGPAASGKANVGIDAKEKPVYYVLEIGRPWQQLCGSAGKSPVGGVVPRKIDAPLQQAARGLVLDNPFEGPAVSTPGLVGGEAVGKRARIGEPGTQISLGKGCVNGTFGVNDPVRTIVTRNPQELKTSIPQEGTWSAMLSVYDRIGARGNVRMDGIVVGPASATCQSVARTFTGKGGFSWTGTCVSFQSQEKPTRKQTYWTANPIDLNGVRIAPATGKILVIESTSGFGPRVLSIDAPPAAIPNSSPTAYDLKGWAKKSAGPVGVVVDDQVIANVPAGNPKIGKTGSGLLNGDLHRAFPANAQATYGGLPFAGTVDVDLTARCKGGAGSRLYAQLKLPSVFGSTASDKAQTSELDLTGCNLKRLSAPTTKTDTGIKQWTADAARTSERAKRAIASVPPATLDLGGATLGPVELTSLVLTYDPATSAFRGTGGGAIFGQKVVITIAITDGELTEAGGTVSIGGSTGVNIPGTPVNLKELGFNVQTKPVLKFVGSARLSDPSGNIVTVDGNIGFQPDPLAITLDGVGSLGPDSLVGLAKVHFEFADGKVSIGGSTAKSIGPFSYEVSASGSFSANGFNVEGSGRACVFACLGVQGVLSDRGAAMCGEIDLWLATLRPGLGVLWKGPDIDGYLDGCSIAPYRGTTAAKSATGKRLAGPWKVTAAPKQTLLSAVAKSGVAGQPPRVKLVGPGGRTITVPAAIVDDQVVDKAAGTLVDVDRFGGAVRFVITTPAAGDWEVVADGPGPLASVEFGYGAPLPTVKDFKAKGGSATNADLKSKVFATVLSTTSKAKTFSTTPKVSKVVKVKKPSTGKKAARLATETVALPYGQQMNAADLGPDLRSLLKTISIDVGGLIPGERVALVERSDPAGTPARARGQRTALLTTPSDFTAQQIAQFTVPASGKIDAKLAYLPGVNGERKRHIDAFIVGASGIPRGVVKNITGYTAKRVATPKLPSLTKVTTAGKRIKLAFKNGPTVGTKSKATQLTAVITGRDGGVRVVSIKGSDFKKSGRGFTVTLEPAGSPKGASVKLVSVGLAGSPAKGAGKVKTVRVK